MINLNLPLLTGVDIAIPAIGISIHQPTIKEISYIGENEFFLAAHTLTINKQTLKLLAERQSQNLDRDIDNIQIIKLILRVLEEDQNKKSMVQDLFTILFPKHTISILPRGFLLKSGEDIVMLDENNYEEFQTILRKICCLELSQQGGDFNPSGKKSAEIAKKLLRARQRVAAIKAKDGESGSLDQYISSLVIGVHSISMYDAIHLTLYQLYDLLERYGKWNAWDIDIKARLAGANNDKPLENWMKQIH